MKKSFRRLLIVIKKINRLVQRDLERCHQIEAAIEKHRQDRHLKEINLPTYSRIT